MERYSFNKIKDEIQFENFSRDFAKLLYPDLTFQLYGKKGQSQFGIDGCSTSLNIYFQSKHKSKDNTTDYEIIKLLKDELKKAEVKINELSKNELSTYLFFTTHSRSTKIQDAAKKSSTKELVVEYWGWDSIDSKLNDFYKNENFDFFFKYYPNLTQNLKHNDKIHRQLSLNSINDSINFIGRETELKVINDKLLSNRVLLIKGIGGIGKSTIANQYLFLYENEYDYYGIFESFSGFISDLKIIFDLKLDDENKIINQIIIKLRNLKGKKLFIIDNISNIEENLKIIDLIKSLKNYDFNVIFVSREQIDEMEFYELDTMILDDAKKLFNSIYKVEDKFLEKILEYLDYHTFFIEKVAKTLKSKETLTPEEIINSLDNGNFSKITLKRKETFEKLLSQLFNIDNLDEEEILILKQMTIFPSAFISFEDLELILQKKDLEDFEDILNYLSDKGWLTKYYDGSSYGYKLHQINKEFLFSSHKPNLEELITPIKFYISILKNSHTIENALFHKNRLVYFEALFKTLKFLELRSLEIVILLDKIASVYHFL